MNIKSRKQKLEKLNKQAAQEAMIKKVAEESDVLAADSSDFSEKVFAKLLESIKIEGLED